MKRCSTSLLKKEMQKTTIYLTTIKMAMLKNKKQKTKKTRKLQMLRRMWRNWNPVHSWWECKMVPSPMENNMEVPEKVDNDTTSKRIESRISKKDLYTHALFTIAKK